MCVCLSVCLFVGPSVLVHSLLHEPLKSGLLLLSVAKHAHSSVLYSAVVGQQSIVISLSVCLCVCLSVSISGTALPNFRKISSRHGSVLLRRCCDTLFGPTSIFIDDVTFRHIGPYGGAWKAEPLTYYH